jgi:hypothetical protein
MLGKIATDMSRRRVKLDHNGFLYWDGSLGKVYVGHKEMVNKDAFIIEGEEELKNSITLQGEAEQDLKAIYGKKKIPRCVYCNGFGTWPDDFVPIDATEVSWFLSDSCEACGSNNHEEYTMASNNCTSSPAWSGTNSIGFHAAIKRFKRSALCVKSSDTQGVKTAQG